MVAMKPENIKIKSNEQLGKIKKDYHVRSREGKHWVYMCEDKTRNHLVVSQKIQLISDYINDSIIIDPHERVSMAGLYQIIGSAGNKVNGYSKFRWKVQPYVLENAAEAFNSLRSHYEHPVVIGTPSCYEMQQV